MSSTFGRNVRVSIFGQSHSPAIGCVIEGIPAGETIDMEELQRFLKRRAPGWAKWSTPRKETDEPEILSGVVNGVTCGVPLAVVIRNTNTKSEDYDNLRLIPRPGHADMVAQEKYHGFQDVSGGGHFSGRLTAPLSAAGGIVKQILTQKGIVVGAHLARVACIDDEPLELTADPGTFDKKAAEVLAAVAQKPFPAIGDEVAERMINAIRAAHKDHDSVGGVIECVALGVPRGIGNPMFEALESKIARVCFGIPAVKGVEFGRGFAASDMRGSEHNDPYRVVDGRIVPITNNAGGILGGISSGEPIVLRVAFKPTSSITCVQQSVNMKTLENEDLKVHGRHDPCVAVRAVPVVEAAVSLCIYDALLEAQMRKEADL